MKKEDEDAIERNDVLNIAAAAPEMIPLDQLCLSNLNVRQTERDVDVASLAEDIAANGLKQNLVIVPADPSTAILENSLAGEDWLRLFEVTAGGRRLQALLLLAADGRIARNHPVPCLHEERDQARSTSLSENLHKVSMNPADEFEAFATIIDQHRAAGAGEEEATRACAKRFGVSQKHVRERLRLSALAPEILEALRTDRIGVDAAKAYATVGDPKLQIKEFKAQERVSWEPHKPRSIRDGLRGKTLSIEDRRIAYVGLEAYLAAGGRTEIEMFMGAEGEERLLDVALLEKMAKEKAEEAIPSISKRAGYKEGQFAQGIGWRVRWPKAPKGFERAYDYSAKPTKAQLKKSIAVYKINEKGDGLTLEGRFKPAGEKSGSGNRYVPPTPEEIAARRKESRISEISAQLAVGKFSGSPFEGRAFWPNSSRWIEAIEAINEDEVMVAVLIKVTKAEIDAQRAAAEAKYAEEEEAAEVESIAAAEATAAEEGCLVEEVLEEMDEEADLVDEVAA